MHLFYTPDISGNIYTLSEEESHHCTKALRLKKDSVIHLTDGKGNLFKCIIFADDHKRCTVRIEETIIDFGKRGFAIHLAVAPTKNTDRFEWFLEKATEIGIDEITPLICEHSERTKFKTDRFQKVIISAMKQSLKAYLPKLNEPCTFAELIKKDFNGDTFIASYDENNSSLKALYTKGKDVLILIGPEGDFSNREIESAKECNFTAVNLGNSRLRTETAAVVACHTINLMNE
jgi:16S rRNA (uracil1498-N3)-methyltransferase